MNNKSKFTRGLYVILGIVTLLIIGIFLKNSGILNHMSSIEDFKSYIESFGDKAYIVFFIFQLLSVIIAPIPSNISAAAGAMIFGMIESSIITVLAIIVGSTIVFLLSRKFGKKFTDKFVSKEISEKYEGLVNSSKGELLISLMLLLPFFPDDMINFLVGISNMDFKRYMVILLLTRPWGIVVSSAVAVANFNIPILGWILIICAVALIINYSSRIEEKLVALLSTI